MKVVTQWVEAVLMILLVGASATASAYADPTTSDGGDPKASLLQRLGTPARPRAVRAALRDARADEASSPVHLAESLGFAGGHAAVDGLAKLLRHPKMEVRIAALEAIEQIGLRSHAACTRIHEIVRDRLGEEQRTAIRTLGVVGRGHDIELLLSKAESDDRTLSRAAFQALRMLTHSRIPYEHARWERFCHVLAQRSSRLLDAGLARLDEDPDAGIVDTLSSELMRYAWLDLALVEEYLGDWSTSTSASRRKLACRFASQLRLADYGRTVRNIRQLAVDEDLRAEADRAMELLGSEALER